VDLSHRCRPLKFTVIVEYGVRKASCGELQDWAREWASLSGLDPSGPRYRKKLDKLTRPIVRSDPKIAKASGSWLDHLRTNEVDLGTDDFWEMRDFRLDPRSGFLRQDPVSMTPMDALNNTPELGLFLNSITGGIHRRDYWVPLRFASGAPLLGAVSRLPKAGVFWAAPGYSDVEARQYFSLNACSGCHSRETGTAFTHIDPSTRALSGFLTGTTVSDPTDPTIPRPFNELARRTQALDVLIQQGCLAVEPLDSLRLVH
jgi:hypothetical protein